MAKAPNYVLAKEFAFKTKKIETIIKQLTSKFDKLTKQFEKLSQKVAATKVTKAKQATKVTKTRQRKKPVVQLESFHVQ